MIICFFENGGGRQFAPLTLTRPVDDLRMGIFTIRDKWKRYLNPDTIARLGRVPLSYLYRADLPDGQEDVVWINSRWLPDTKAAKAVANLQANQFLRYDKVVVAMRLDMEKSREWFHSGTTGIPADFISGNESDSIATQSGTVLAYLWDLFEKNNDEILKDVALLAGSGLEPAGDIPGVMVTHPGRLYMKPGAKIDPGTVIDTSGGPVYLGSEAHVMAGCMIQGPAALCSHSVLKMGTKVYSGTTIGPVCKVAGEIQNVIMHSHSNKAHDGFLGNSLIGEWCNLGAHTTTSNLRNNYKPIKIPEWATGRIHRSPIQFFGTVMGDHGKTAINTTLSAGTLCGVFCNIFTYGFPPKHVPSFSWVSPHHTEPYQFEKAMETAEIMMARRGIPLKKDYLMMMRHIFDHREVMG